MRLAGETWTRHGGPGQIDRNECLDATGEKIFGFETVVLSVYYAKDNSFMVAPASEELFRTIHKANQQMLKRKNLAGDKSISIQELILDHDMDETDRNLEFTMEEALHILKIKL